MSYILKVHSEQFSRSQLPVCSERNYDGLDRENGMIALQNLLESDFISFCFWDSVAVHMVTLASISSAVARKYQPREKVVLVTLQRGLK